MKLNLNAQDGAGWCLRFTQSVFGAPAMHDSAWLAWEATKKKHRNRNLPDAPVPVWFSHEGTYGTPPRYDNWGHVVAYVPGRGFLSSPLSGYGSQWFDSIAAVEEAFRAKFVGWSEDLNTKTIYTPKPKGLTLSEYKKLEALIKKENKRIYDHITYQFNITRGPSHIGWLKSKVWGIFHRKANK